MALDRTRPVVPQIANTLAERIAAGDLPLRSRMPSVVEIAGEFDVAVSTAQRVTAELKRRGLVRTEVGLGTFVADLPDQN